MVILYEIVWVMVCKVLNSEYLEFEVYFDYRME